MQLLERRKLVSMELLIFIDDPRRDG